MKTLWIEWRDENGSIEEEGIPAEGPYLPFTTLEERIEKLEEALLNLETRFNISR